MNVAFTATQVGSSHPSDNASLSALKKDIASRREEFSRQQFVSHDIVERLRKLGVYRAMIAKQFGGDELSPAEFCQLIESISVADGSVGWVASFGVSHIYLAALPEATLRQIYSDGPDVVFAGVQFPLLPATRTADGYIINGRWKFGSGCTSASVIGVGVMVERDSGADKVPGLAVMPASKVEIVKNWDVIGLRGTGSHDLVIRDVPVTEDWTLIRGGRASIDCALYRYPSVAFAAQVLAVVGLGIARSALETLKELSSGRASVTGAPVMADRPYVQIQTANAEATLRSARAFFYEAIETVWEKILKGDTPLVDDVAMLRLASTNAARAGAEVARIAFGLAGTAAIYDDHHLSRNLNDSAVVAQHAMLGEGTLQSAGRIFLGLPPIAGFP